MPTVNRPSGPDGDEELGLARRSRRRGGGQLERARAAAERQRRASPDRSARSSSSGLRGDLAGRGRRRSRERAAISPSVAPSARSWRSRVALVLAPLREPELERRSACRRASRTALTDASTSAGWPPPKLVSSLTVGRVERRDPAHTERAAPVGDRAGEADRACAARSARARPSIVVVERRAADRHVGGRRERRGDGAVGVAELQRGRAGRPTQLRHQREFATAGASRSARAASETREPLRRLSVSCGRACR